MYWVHQRSCVVQYNNNRLIASILGSKRSCNLLIAHTNLFYYCILAWTNIAKFYTVKPACVKVSRCWTSWRLIMFLSVTKCHKATASMYSCKPTNVPLKCNITHTKINWMKANTQFGISVQGIKRHEYAD